ncbi:hypothetical protein GCM10012275_38070 [Longimycelium tulufanense]|uniref:Uncharacterized protein n=1 Tax=Longimycelium tulufanense TaxID=907463 RepID=A0A8J3FVI1_9PSEU|nr:hypothetical protein GCM10012275_38070 [Longimycelium tulufanense]
MDLDEAALVAARERLGTKTLKDTVNVALRIASGRDPEGRDIDAALDVLASFQFEDRDEAWR